MPGIGKLLALVLMAFCTATLTSLVVAALDGDLKAVEVFGFLTITYGTISAFIYMVATTKSSSIKRVGVFMGAIAMWVTMVAIAMPPFMMLENAHPVAAFFEASSAVVTLGTTLLPINAISISMTIYRSIVAWLGGLLTLMLAVYVLGRYGIGGTPNRDLRFVLHGASRGTPRLLATFFEVAIPYLAVTIICIISLMIAGVNPVHAIFAALNTLSTNGFLGWATNGSVFNNRLGEIVLLIFMLIGASSIIWQRTLFSKQLNQTYEQQESLKFLIFGAGAIILGVSFSIASYPLSNQIGNDIFNRTFDIISTLTTTGIVHTPTQGTHIPFIILIGLALVGGTSYSTAGGIKIFRVSAMMQHSTNEIMRLIYPSQLIKGSIDTDSGKLSNSKAVWSAFFSVIIFIVIGLSIFTGLGHDFQQALALSVGAFSSVASLVSDNLYHTDGSGVPYLSLLWIGLMGIAGRIELLVLLAALSRNRW